MARLDVDKMVKGVFEEIAVVVEGVEYTVGKITSDMLKVDTAGEDAGAGGQQLAKMLGVKADTFADTDIRVIMAALKFVMDQVTAQLSTPVKNLPEAEDTSTAK